MYETGGMRRVHLQGRENILKRLLVHGAGFNLSLILRKTMRVGKPRRLQGLYLQFFAPLRRLFVRIEAIRSRRSDLIDALRRKVGQFVTGIRPTHICATARKTSLLHGLLDTELPEFTRQET